MNKYSNYNIIHEAILNIDIQKDEYVKDYSKKYPFIIKALTPLESDVGRTIHIKSMNIMNSDLSWLSTVNIDSSNSLNLVVPPYLLMDIDNKVPKGLKFMVGFIGGNINNCQIIGRAY